MFLSLIVPVYNMEKYLDKCLDTLLLQTLKDYEIILVDDGSPDKCPQICDEWAQRDSRIRVIHKENGGLSDARNAGINVCTGEYISFVDSDDFIKPDMIEKLYSAATKMGADIVACGILTCEGDKCTAWGCKDFVGCPKEIYALLYDDAAYPVAAWNKLYHRSLLEKLRYPVGKLHEDEFTTYRAIFAAGKIAVTPVRLYAYYQNPNGIMNAQWSPKRMHMLEAFDQQIAFAQEQGYARLLHKSLEGAIYSTYGQLGSAQKVFHKELRKRLRRLLKQGREADCGLGYRQLQWAYEAAYPCKAFWWIISKVGVL